MLEKLRVKRSIDRHKFCKTLIGKVQMRIGQKIVKKPSLCHFYLLSNISLERFTIWQHLHICYKKVALFLILKDIIAHFFYRLCVNIFFFNSKHQKVVFTAYFTPSSFYVWMLCLIKIYLNLWPDIFQFT